uniref:Cnidarian restricted protein n=1 Tax=Clytia hemisphaerica TaxID=252671 RepID=A0A7M5UZV0_9CNID
MRYLVGNFLTSCMFKLILVIFTFSTEVWALCNHGTEYKYTCRKLPSYNSYQWARCYKNSEIKTFGKNHTNGCFDDSRQFCYYPCQMERHEQFYGSVSKDCKCALMGHPPPCNERTRGQQTCRSVEGYFGFTKMTCWDKKYIRRITGNSYPCGAEFCWLPCEREKNQKSNGDVSAECSCTYSNAWRRGGDSKLLLTFLVGFYVYNS